MKPPKMPVSRRTQIAFREALVGWTVREIGDLFDGAGIPYDSKHQPNVSGVRRTLVEQHYAALDLANPVDLRRLLDAYEDVLSLTSAEQREGLVKSLKRDGVLFQDGKLLLSEVVGGDDLERLAVGMDVAHLREYIAHMNAFANSNPALAVGAAKELVEACCKSILQARDKPVAETLKLPQLVRQAAAELQLLPADVSKHAKGAEVIRRTLSNLMSVVDGIGELRGLYGSGHGRDGRWRGVTPRHARLVAGAAATLSTFLLETHLAREPWADPRKFDGRYVTPGFDEGQTGAEINLIELGDGTIEVQAFALWVNPSQPQDKSSPHLGELHARVVPQEMKLGVAEGECEITITREGTKLSVIDTGNCGGVNVSFAGEYERIGPPQFVGPIAASAPTNGASDGS